MEANETGTLKRKLRNTRIWIIALIILVFMAYVYAFFQQTLAKKAAMEALKQRELAIEAQTLAEEQRMIALKNEALALEILKECQSKK